MTNTVCHHAKASSRSLADCPDVPKPHSKAAADALNKRGAGPCKGP